MLWPRPRFECKLITFLCVRECTTLVICLIFVCYSVCICSNTPVCVFSYQCSTSLLVQLVTSHASHASHAVGRGKKSPGSYILELKVAGTVVFSPHLTHWPALQTVLGSRNPNQRYRIKIIPIERENGVCGHERDYSQCSQHGMYQFEQWTILNALYTQNFYMVL